MYHLLLLVLFSTSSLLAGHVNPRPGRERRRALSDPDRELRQRNDRPYEQVRYAPRHSTTDLPPEEVTTVTETEDKSIKKVSDDDYLADYQADSQDFDPFPAKSNWQKADGQGAFRINSPRKEDRGTHFDPLLNSNGDLSSKKPDYISVKLPDDIQKHLGRQYGMGQEKRNPGHILGIPTDHLNDFEPISQFDESPDNNGNEESQSIASTTISPFAHYDHNDQENDYYDKNDFLPKIKQDAKELPDVTNKMKTPEQNPVDDGRERSLWSIAWQAHIYFSGTLFILLAIYCTVNICRLHTFSRLFSRGYFLSLNICMILIGVSRGVFLFFDAYNTSLTLPNSISYILLNIGYPCITSAFAILFLALLRVTQVELLSPSVQTPKVLGIFCLVHFGLSISLDIIVGLVTSLQYILLLGQGIFIVWSLLLSAGYFYIYSTLNKIVARHHSDGSRSVYPKLMFDQSGVSGTYSMRIPQERSNPLSRAVHLTLGVAVLGSLMGGVQLYGMIGMHGLLRNDPTVEFRSPAWYGYQVALRVLEVMICYLLAVVATTPLRQDATGGSPRSSGGACSSCSPLLCCHGDGQCSGCQANDNPPTQLDEDIYTEICSNNQSVRALNSAESSCYNQAAMMPMGTLNHSQPMMPMSTSGQHLTNTLGRRGPVAVGRNSGTCQSQVSADSSATVDTALYSNLRSRPSSMLFNDSGFVRFRLGEDPRLAQDDVLHQSTHDLAQAGAVQATSDGTGVGETMKGSRSFNDAVLFETKHPYSNTGSPHERPQSNLSYVREVNDSRLIKSELCSPDKPDVEFLPGLPTRPASGPKPAEPPPSSPVYNMNGSDIDHGEKYEMPAGLIIPDEGRSLATAVKSAVGYSESDLSSVDPLYAGRSIYGYERAPSRCSSISATQSFDMRVYGRTGAATLGRGMEKPKLENKFYYYGSTRGQKKSSHKDVPLKPRPLLPSQRSLADPRVQGSPTPARVATGPSSNPGPGQSLYEQIKGGRVPQGPADSDSAAQAMTNFQRSRSLGHHYQRDVANAQPIVQAGTMVQAGVPPVVGMPQLPPRPPGPRTPQSVARRVLETVTKRHNRSKNKSHRSGTPLGQAEEIAMMNTLNSPKLVQTADGRLVAVTGHVPPGHFVTTQDGMIAQGPLVQTADGRLLVGRPVMLQRQVSVDREDMFRGREDAVWGPDIQAAAAQHGMMTHTDQLRYPHPGEEPIYSRGQTYGRMPYGIRLQGEIRQVLGTPPAGRHAVRPDSRGGVWQERPDSRGGASWQQDQQAARLAGQHFLASPPDLPRQPGQKRTTSPQDVGKRKQQFYEDDSDIQSSVDQFPSQATQGYNDGLADNELDSEVSSLFGGGDNREAKLQNLHLMSPLEYAAMLKQYTEPCGVLGQDITPDSGVVMDSRHHSKERDMRQQQAVSGRAMNKTEIDSHESSDSSDSARHESLLARNRYRLVPTHSDKPGSPLSGSLAVEPDLGHDGGDSSVVLQSEDESVLSPWGETNKKESRREANCAAFEWDGSKLVPSDPQALAVRQRMQSTLSEQTEPDGVTDSENVSESCTEYSMDCLLSDNCPDSDRSDVEATQERDKIVNVCSEIKARFNNDMASGEEEVV